jgi:hypothetical protein
MRGSQPFPDLLICILPLTPSVELKGTLNGETNLAVGAFHYFLIKFVGIFAGCAGEASGYGSKARGCSF